VFIDTFLWCPEAAYGDEAHKRAAELAERAHLAYRVSEKTLARISERDRPDGLFSIAQLPMWEPQDVRLGESPLIMVADGMEIRLFNTIGEARASIALAGRYIGT
jgi:TrmH family RNA methyltransferase